MVQQVHTTKGGNMRRMKKAIAMGLATMMTISLAACGNTSGETTQETSGAATTENTGSGENLTFSWWGNQTRNDMTMKVIDMYCAENAGVSIDGQFSTFSDYWEKLATYAAGNSLPDVIQMDYKYLQQYADKGLLISLDDYIKSWMHAIHKKEIPWQNFRMKDGETFKAFAKKYGVYGIPYFIYYDYDWCIKAVYHKVKGRIPQSVYYKFKFGHTSSAYENGEKTIDRTPFAMKGKTVDEIATNRRLNCFNKILAICFNHPDEAIKLYRNNLPKQNNAL